MDKKIILNDETLAIHITKKDKNHISFDFNGHSYHFDRNNSGSIIFKNKSFPIKTEKFDTKGTIQTFVGDFEGYLSHPGKVQSNKQAAMSEGSLQSPMPGKIFKVLKAEGEKVEVNEPILILEAMKMEHTIKAQKEGVLKTIFFKEGEQVTGGAQLCEIE